ncbi:YcaO-like family protein [Salmonella enterica]|nr:microcin B17 processing protein McbC [Salmonella enterica subsp. enterica]EDT6561737.1 microcin B17 processing protein McbC [Salmonella enterica subsp. enterica]EDV0395449.1 microcin B17 processing protein McbC [Salmonella enterica subsp. enterica]EHP1945070.1 YcaO-like family protein [Salmonella enterica]EME8396472.1 YcaO-like family protein [Salmonella enterica]
MINVYSNLMSAWPATIVMSPKLNRNMPTFSQVWDYERITPASAAGETLKSIQGAIGEYFERRHFFNEIIANGEKTLYEMMTQPAAEAFTEAFVQTSSLTQEEVRAHKFKTARAFNLFSLEKQDIPAVVVALDNITAVDDLKFYPDRDTCGCSFHCNLNDAIEGALCEFMERQSLLLYWLQGKANYEISSKIMTGNNHTDEILKSLRSEGEIRIFDITLPGAPGYAVLTLYGTTNPDSQIKYSTGLSYANSLDKALCKSVTELWQSYICLHNFIIGGYTDDDVIDSYQRHFMSCNKYESFIDLCENTVLLTDDIKLTVEENLTQEQNLLEFLKKISGNIFVYYARERASDNLVWYTKIVSPDFFLHMNNFGAINLNNNIYRTGKGVKHRESKMVPFP